jgi:putative ABC transport system ATP-binding protein
MDCGGKRSATPLFARASVPVNSSGPRAPKSAVVAALCRRSPRSSILARTAFANPLRLGLRGPAQRDPVFGLERIEMTTTATTTPAVEAIGLTKIYGSGNTEVVAMKDVSLQLARGEVVALLGPSGAGKSTFLTAIGLINPPTSGRIVIGGEPVMDGNRALVNVRAYRRQHLGFVFQKANLIPFLNAVENVAIAMEINDVAPRAARKRAMELLDYLGVADRANNLPDALSGGQQQRVAVARALANQPSLILADEPTAALDSQRGRQVMELFRKVAHERGSAVIVVTHDHRSLDVFDRSYEMEDGQLVAK